jgi:homoserine dehydrogenase
MIVEVTMKIAILGFGTVGKGAYEIAKDADNVEVKYALVRQMKPEYAAYTDITFTTTIDDIISDAEVELVVESIGGISPAKEYVIEAMQAGKHVVTPNKALVSAYFGELHACAKDNNVEVRYTPTAGGGIPWLFNLARTLRCDDILSVSGIINGTCNYILDAMHDNGSDFDEMLSKAKELGYAEADPTADICGYDTMRKAVISSNIAFNTVVSEDNVLCFGIDKITKDDIDFFNSRGYVCKLMMNSKVNGNKISVYVEPTLFPSTALEANVKDCYNMVTLQAKNMGTQSFYGPGAGSLQTGESVIQDVLDIIAGIKQATPSRLGETTFKVDNSSEVHRYYIRHDRMCDHIKPMVESFEEKDGVFYCITKPLAVSDLHEMANHRINEKHRMFFFAGIAE